MNRLKKYLMVAAALSVANSHPATPQGRPIQTTSDIASRQKQLNDLIDKEWKYELVLQPEMATALGEPGLNDKLSDPSPSANRTGTDRKRRFLTHLETIDATGLPEQDQLNEELLGAKLREDIKDYEMKVYEMPFDQLEGIHLFMAQLVAFTSFRNVKDYEDYLARLHQIRHAFDGAIEAARAGRKDGLMPPRYLLEKVVMQATALAAPGEKSPFAQPVTKFPDNVDEVDRQRLRAAVLKAIENDVAPAYRKVAAFVRTEYAPYGRQAPGIWAVPNGDRLYRFLVHKYTTTDLTPDQIHELGQKQVAELETEMTSIAKALGYSDLKSFQGAIRNDPKRYATSREQILEFYRKYTDEMYGKASDLFGIVPKARLTVVPVETYREKEAAAAQYYLAAGDGSRPGQMVVNTGDFAHRALYLIESTAYHEGIPGHHLQISRGQELQGVPPFRKLPLFDAFVEGWGLYAERLGKEVGLYQDPYSDFGRLTGDMLRAIRLVVDTGVHAKHWTRQQMVDYFHQHSAEDEPTVQAEVDRYIVWPGQALAYKVGELKILELRDRARAELGAKFDIKAFHDELLAGGTLPLDVLERRMTAWIVTQKQN